MKPLIRVLVVDDEEPIRRLLKKELGRKGFHVDVASNGKSALDILKDNVYDVVLLDIIMPGMDGISTMKIMKSDPSPPAVIVLTARATVETAVDAMKNGAFDYLTKPYKLDELVIIINRAFEYTKMSIKNQLLEQELVRKDSFSDFIAESKQIRAIQEFIKKIAPTDSAVFIQGESGTGKELVANTVWQYSTRNKLPFIALNCATFSESLIESEIFGHEKGAFTNAYQTKHGIVEVADNGTLFLDEIGEMPLGLQPTLLRFLESGEYRRVGSNKIMKVDVRLITATNQDLQELLKTGKFREDLYYRLNVINITIPPLRERRDDIPGLSRYFLNKYSQKLSKLVTDFEPDAMQVLTEYRWPGNVRELENVVERAVIICDSEKITSKELSIHESIPAHVIKPSSLADIEKEHIARVLRETQGNQTKASQVLGIDRKTLYYKIKKFGLEELNGK